MSSDALIKYKAAKCGELLAKSALSDEIKNRVIEGVAGATENDLDRLLSSLEREQLELERLEREFEKFEKGNDEEWKILKNKQEEMAQVAVDKFLAEEIGANI